MVNQLYYSTKSEMDLLALSPYKRISRSPLYHQPTNKIYKVGGKGRTKKREYSLGNAYWKDMLLVRISSTHEK